jgi:hypothetical protein
MVSVDPYVKRKLTNFDFELAGQRKGDDSPELVSYKFTGSFCRGVESANDPILG